MDVAICVYEKNHLQEGVKCTWHKNKKKQSEAQFDNFLCSSTKWYYDDGALQAESEYDNDGKPLKHTVFDKRGTVLSQISYYNGFKELKISYDDDDNLYETIEYSSAIQKPDGEYKLFYPDGSIFRVQKYSGGALHGKQVSFYKDNVPRSVETYSHGSRSGVYKKWH